MKFRNASRSFAGTTTFHGLHELFLPTNKLMRVIWSIIMLISIVLCIWQLYQTVAEFQSQPTSMRVFTKQLDEYPTVYFSVFNTIDYQKLKQYGLDSRHGQYILDHFPAVPVEAGGWQEIASDPKQIEKIRADIQRVQDENGWDFADLVRAVANSPESFYWVDASVQVNLSIAINEYGISHAFKRSVEIDVHGDTYTMGIVVSDVTTKPQFDSNRRCLRGYQGVYLSVGDDVHDYGQWYLVKWKAYNLFMTPKMTRSVSTKQRPCSTEYNNTRQCRITCRARNEACGRGCEWFVGQKVNQSQRFCLNAIDRGNINGSCMGDCKALCPPSCEVWSYNMQVMFELEFDNANTATTYIFMSSMEVMASEEYFSYSSSTLFSNIGGILSLYLGASVLSFMHLVYFWLFKARMKAVDVEGA